MLLSGRVPTAYNAAARFHRRTQRQHELVNVTINTISCSASTGCARDGHHEMLRAAVSLLVKTLYRLNNPPPSRRPTPSKTRVYPRSFSYALPPSSPPSVSGAVRRETKKLQPMFGQKGAVRRPGTVPPLPAIGLGMPLRHVPHAWPTP